MTSNLVPLFSLAEWKNGLAFRKLHFSPVGKPIIKIAELKNGITAQTAYTQQEFDPSVYLTRGDMVFSWSGNPETSIDVFWYDLPDGWLNQHIFKVTPKRGIDKHYLYYLLKFLKPQFAAIASNKQTTGLGHVTVKDMRELMVLLPEVQVQKAIGSFLYLIDHKAYINNQINDNLQQQAQVLFEQKFIFDGIEGSEKPLYDFADYVNGAAFKQNECGEHGLPIIKITELKNGITDSTKYFDGFKGEKYLVQNKDILFSWSGNPETSIDIFIWTCGKAILNQHTFNVKSNTGHRWFTFLMLKYFKPEFSRIASNKQTTGLGHVTANDLKRLTFIYNETAIDDFEREIGPIMEMIFSNMLENQKLAQLRDTLLPKLMSGEIDVSNIQ